MQLVKEKAVLDGTEDGVAQVESGFEAPLVEHWCVHFAVSPTFVFVECWRLHFAVSPTLSLLNAGACTLQ